MISDINVIPLEDYVMTKDGCKCLAASRL